MIAIWLSILAVCSLLVACADRTVWGHERGTLEAALAHDPEWVFSAAGEGKLEEIVTLGNAWPMATAMLAEMTGMDELAGRLLAVGFEHTDADVRKLYGGVLADHLLDHEQYDQAEAITERLVSEYPGEAELLHQHLQAVYWQRRPEDTLEIISRLHRTDLSSLGTFERDELDLKRAASLARIDVPGWRREFFALFANQPISSIHLRAYQFLVSRGAEAFFTDVAFAYMRAHALAASGQHRESVEALPSHERIVSELFITSPVVIEQLDLLSGATTTDRSLMLENLYRIHAGADEYAGFYELMERAIDSRVMSGLESDIRFFAGRAARELGWYAAAVDHFAAMRSLPQGGIPPERALWYLIDTSRRWSVWRGVDMVVSLGAEIEHPDYFDDTFEDLLGDALRTLDFDLITRSAGLLTSYGSSSMRAMSAQVIAVLDRHDLLPGVHVSTGGFQVPGTASDYGPRATYYRLQLGGDVGFAVTEGEPEAPAQDGPVEQKGNRFVGEVLELLMRLGHPSTISSWVERYEDHLSVSQLTAAAAVLRETGDYADSMRIADRVAPVVAVSQRGTIPVELAESWFPLAFEEEIRAAAGSVADASGSAGASLGLFYALVREESYFQPEVVSFAGAVGLSQLIPSTAQDMANRLEMRAVELTRPADNLAIGAAYLSYCIELFDSELLGLMAYNAGLGRVRRWLEAYDGLPIELFPEAIPIDETRHYVRKVVRALAAYRTIHPDIASAADLSVLLAGRFDPTTRTIGDAP